MAKKKEQRSSELLSSFMNLDGLEEDEKTGTQEDKTSRRREDKKLSLQEPERVKRGYLLDEEVVRQIDDVQYEHRKETGQRAEKSEIVEAALRVAFADFGERGPESLLGRLLAERY